jgi:hypothetical protein
MKITVWRVALPSLLPLALLAAGPASADTYAWSAASGQRPDATGAFTRVASGSANDGFTAAGALQLNSGAHSEYMHYLASGAQLAMPQQLVLAFSARYVDGSSASSLRSPLMVSANFDGGAGALLMIDGRSASFIEGSDLHATPGAQLLPGEFHHYRLTFFGQAVGDAVQLEIDGVPRYTYSLQQNANNYPGHARIWFGDATLYASGSSEWLNFSHNAAAPVPEPASALLLAAGCAALLWHRRRALPTRDGIGREGNIA